MAEEQCKLEAQEALDELWNERRLRFQKLTATKVERMEDLPGYYRILFSDYRIASIAVYWSPPRESFKRTV